MTSSSVRALAALDGRVALVTGGAGHIGGALVDALEEVGASVAVADLRIAAADSGQRMHFEVDLRDERHTRALVDAVVARYGRLDVLVHCAGYTGTTALDGWAVSFEQQSVAAWDEAMRVNLTAAFVLAQQAGPALRQSGRGSIVFIGSTYGSVGPDVSLYAGTEMHNPAAYGASKAGLVQLARHLSVQYAPDVRANVISPGGLFRGQPQAFVDRYITRTPLRRMATEDDLKGAAVYLASDLSAYVTGHNLVVDGGWTAW